MSNEQAALKKAGEQVIIVDFERKGGGLHLNVKTVPEIEEFFRSCGNGESEAVNVHGRHWASPRALQVWNWSMPLTVFTADDGSTFTLHRPGQQILELDLNRSGRTVLNMSFLRLVGTSQDSGVSFNIRSVSSPEELAQLSDRVARAARQLYIMFLKPVRISVKLSTEQY